MRKPLLVIVGAGPGVSAGIARKFGNNGFRIVLLARKQATLDLQMAELQEKNIGLDLNPFHLESFFFSPH